MSQYDLVSSCSENHPQPASGCVPRGLSCVPRAVTPSPCSSSCSCLLGGYMAYPIVRMVGHPSVTSPPVIAHKDHSTFFCLSFQVYLIPWGQLALSLSQWPKPRVRGGGSSALEHLLLAKTFHDLRVAHSLAARKVTAVISDVSRNSCHTQARCWRMTATCTPLA